MNATPLSEIAESLWDDALALAQQQLGPPLVSILSPLYWPHLVSAVLMAALVIVWERNHGRAYTWASLKSTLRAWVHPSALTDYTYWFVNGIVYSMAVVPLLPDDAPLRDAVVSQLYKTFGERSSQEQTGTLTVTLLALAIFVAYDFGRFVGHFLQHKVPFLWEFHKVHHTARVLNPFTTFRMHPVDLAVMAVCTSLSVAGMAGFILYLFPGDESLWGALSLRVALAFFVFDLLGSTLRHTSVWLSYGPILGRIFISPAQHQVHHSADPKHFGKNMGFVLAIWDWAARTLYLTGKHETLTYGAGDGDDDAYRGPLRIYGMPLIRAAQRVYQTCRKGMGKLRAAVRGTSIPPVAPRSGTDG
ncbi:MAG: sterol desaturase family protein [Polyangiaceae bacterium]|nr:sterol desaturase family protein [Polyangiaceae bacterium]